MILWEDLLKAEMAKLAAMPKLQGKDKLFWAELDEIEELCWSWPSKAASTLWPECSVRDSKNQPPAKTFVTGIVVS